MQTLENWFQNVFRGRPTAESVWTRLGDIKPGKALAGTTAVGLSGQARNPGVDGILTAASLPPEPWDETTWKGWTLGLAASLGRKGKALFHPLRLALTARENGPEMARLLPLIGRTTAVARLSGQTA